MSIVAVDIGGTQLRTASYPTDSNQATKQARSFTHESGNSVYDRLVHGIEEVWPQDRVDAIGMASPGPLDPFSGVILATPNIREWKDFPVGPKLNEQFHVPVYIDNDGNLAALAEWKFGAGKGHHNVFYLTVSTGIGGGVIVNDRLLQGHHGLAGEVGHMMIDPDGPPCGCGGIGHVESFANGPSIERYVRDQISAGAETTLPSNANLSTKKIAEAAIQGDKLARSAFARAGEYLGMAVANYLAIFDPSIVILGGGITQVGDLLIDPLKESLKKRVLHPRYLEGLVITTALLGDDAGLLGALALARLYLQKKGN